MNKNRRLLQQQLWDNCGIIIILLILSIAISILSLTVPWFMQYFTDTVIIERQSDRIWDIVSMFLLIILFRFAVDLLYEKLLAYVVFQRVVLSLRKRVEYILIHMKCKYLYKKEQEMGEKDIETILLGDVDAFKNILMQTIKFFTEVLKLVVYIAILFYYSVPIGLIVCVRIPVYYLVSNCFDRPLSSRNEQIRASQSGIIQKVKKIFQSLPAIKTFQMEDAVVQDLDQQTVKYCKN